MSDTFTAEEQAILSPEAPQAQLPAKVDAPTPETPAPTPEPAVAEAPKPAAAPPQAKIEPEPKPEHTKPPPGYVPVRELIEMRRELAELKRQRAPEAQKPPETAIPAFDQDPANHLKARVDSAEDAVRQVLQTNQRNEARTQIVAAYSADLAAKAAADPSYIDARQHWLNTLGAYIAEEQPELSQSQVAAVVEQRELQLVLGALQRGESPAERMKLAATRLYYAAKPPAAAPAEPAAPAAPPAQTLLQEVARGQQMAASPIAGAGATPVPELTAATLAGMSEEDFAKVSANDWRRAMGG